MVSFEEKKVIFKSFKLKEKTISNGRVNFIYPESKQKGQVLAREIQPSGNGYVIGKYMPNEVLEENGYKVDARGWISIKDLPKEELAKLITEAMKSMSGQEVKSVKVGETLVEDGVVGEIPDDMVIVEAAVDHIEEAKEESIITPENEAPAEKENVKIQKPDTKHTAHQDKHEDPYLEYEQYPLSCWFAWVGLALSTMETSFLIWRNTVRKYGELRKK